MGGGEWERHYFIDNAIGALALYYTNYNVMYVNLGSNSCQMQLLMYMHMHKCTNDY